MEAKEIEGFPGYLITPNGEVIGRRLGKPMKPETIWSGYKRVSIFDESGQRRHVLVHRLVAEAFIPNPDNKRDVNHIDECKTNNAVSNLEWVTRSENCRHGTANARRAEKHRKKVRNVDTGEVFNSIGDAAKTIATGKCHIGGVCDGKHKTAGGYRWEYITN